MLGTAGGTNALEDEMARGVPLIERKLAAPTVRAELVPRRGLLAVLNAHRSEPVVVVATPPGYGKTTLLAQWVDADDRRTAWLTLDAQDNSPAVLLRHLAAVLDRVAPGVAPTTRVLERSLRVYATALPHLRAALASMAAPFVLVLDDAHLISDPAAVDILATLAENVPSGSQVAFASRDVPSIPLGRLRARRQLVELGTSDLALDDQEADALLREVGVPLLPADVHELAQRTEGWAAGLYLAALSMTAAGSTAAIHARFPGTDRFVADFLRSELLDRLDPDEQAFVRSTSVLDEMSGPLVDHVLGCTGSGARLVALESSNRFVVPLDREREWFRYHTLFRELLASELHAQEPERITELRARAADWYVEAGMPERGLAVAFEAEDFDRAAGIFLQIAMETYWEGEIGTLLGWIRQFGPRIESYPDVASIAALITVLVGDEVTPMRLLRSVPAEVRLAFVADVARTLLIADGVANAREAADRAVASAPVGTRFRAQALLCRSIIAEAEGDEEGAEAFRAQIGDLPDDLVAPPARSAALAMRARHAMHAGDWSTAEALSHRARAVVLQHHLEDYSTTFIIHVVAARVALHRGDRTRAVDELMAAQRLRAVVTSAAAAYALLARVEMGRAYLALGDTPGVQTMIADADQIIRRRPDLGVLPRALEALRAQVAAAPGRPSGSTTLTGAEMRLLPYLPTHLTYGAIAARLSLSENTVKTQAGSIYGKLDANTRMEAVAKAQEIGLLER